MRGLVMAALIIVNAILQTTIFSYIEIFGIRPNTSLLIIVTYAMLRGDVEGAVVGFFTGLLQDFMFGRVVGLYAVLGFLTGFVCGKPFQDFYRENILLPIMFVGISCVCYEFAFYVLYFLFQGKIEIFYFLRRIIFPEAIYCVALTVPFYRMMYAINSRLELHERYTRKLF